MAAVGHGPNEILPDSHFRRFRDMVITFLIFISTTVMTAKFGAGLLVYYPIPLKVENNLRIFQKDLEIALRNSGLKCIQKSKTNNLVYG